MMKERSPLFVRINLQEQAREENEFRQKMLASGLPLSRIEARIAEWLSRRPVPIPLTGWAIRPFWRGGKEVPPLPLVVPHNQKIIRMKK